jgi:acetylornithine deacetylase/succinyl-diaminopimelate desuccinylase-like protein
MAAVEYARENQARFLDELKNLLRIPSISTLPEHNGDTRRAAETLAAEMKRIGLEHVRLIETEHGGAAGHPLVYGDWLHAAGKPTVLCYGHYDVQPPDPLDEWLTPPFEPTERDGNLYARGAVDDKGQMYMHLKALESLFQSSKEGAREGKLPVNVRVILEGEEEVGGEGIANFVREHPEELKADFALVSDTEMFAPELPTLCVGLRGMIYTEIEVRGAKVDLHSGMYGGAAPNPFVALAQIIAGLKDREGRILIPGFYDDVEAPSAEEKAAWKRLPFDEEHYRKTEVGSPVLTGEAGYSVLERTWARSLTPKGVTVEVRMIHSADPLVIRTDNPYVTAAEAAMREVFGKETVFVRGGGSIPIVGDIERHLKIPAVMMGFGLPDDNLHAPNEKFHIANFHRGIESIIRMLEIVSG